MQAVRDLLPSLCEALLVEGAGDPTMALYHILISARAPLLSGAGDGRGGDGVKADPSGTWEAWTSGP